MAAHDFRPHVAAPDRYDDAVYERCRRSGLRLPRISLGLRNNFGTDQTRCAAAILADLGVPLTIHQPRYNMLDRVPEQGLLAALDELGVGAIAFSPLAGGLLTDRYLSGHAGALRPGVQRTGAVGGPTGCAQRHVRPGTRPVRAALSRITRRATTQPR